MGTAKRVSVDQMAHCSHCSHEKVKIESCNVLNESKINYEIVWVQWVQWEQYSNSIVIVQLLLLIMVILCYFSSVPTNVPTSLQWWASLAKDSTK